MTTHKYTIEVVLKDIPRYGPDKRRLGQHVRRSGGLGHETQEPAVFAALAIAKSPQVARAVVKRITETEIATIHGG